MADAIRDKSQLWMRNLPTPAAWQANRPDVTGPRLRGWSLGQEKAQDLKTRPQGVGSSRVCPVGVRLPVAASTANWTMLSPFWFTA